MRKLAFAGSVLLVAAALSCTRELEVVQPTGQEYVFEAVWADGNGTRTALQPDGTSVWWTTEEEINVFYGSLASSKFTSTNTEPAPLTSFSGSLPVITGSLEGGNSGQAFWGVYPYDAANTCDGESVTLTVPSRQPATDGSFADKFFPAVAMSRDFALAFYNVCGGARFSVANEGIYAVTIEAIGGENLVGKVKVAFGSDGKPVVQQVTDGSSEVTVNAPAGGFVPGKYYFAAFLPGTLSHGFKVTYRTATQSASVNLDQSLTVNRSRFGTIDRKDEGLTFVDGGGAEGGYAMPEAIDLGLSVKWASFNLGATKPEEYGNHYAWGETAPKDDYSWATYKWAMGTENTLTKYCISPDYGYNGYTDGNTILDPEDDAATVNLGGNWRMPTVSEWYELVNNCIWTYTEENGVKGFKLTSRIAGYQDRSIFLPAAGAYVSGTLYNGNTDGYYWVSLLNPSNNKSSFMWMLSDYEYNSGLNRYYGLPVRPVYGDGSAQAEVENISLDETEINLLVGETRQLTATIDPVAVTEPLLEWGTDQYTIATVSDSGVVTAVAPGSTTITVITFDGGKTAVCKVNVSKTVPIPNAVDLGLTSGLLWADTNMGATSPEDAGNFYAWAETGTKENYGWESYKWCMGTEKTLTKYVANPEYGYNGMRDTFELVYEHEDDVVCEEFGYNYGQGWRLPSVSAWEELREECDWEWTTRNGKEGFLVSSKTNSNSIFLPAAGIKAGTTSIDKGGYWTSEYDKYYSSEAYCLHLVEERIEDEQAHITHIYRTYNVESLQRCYGMNVRPVFW